MSYLKPLPVSGSFQLLASLLYIDPEDLEEEELIRVFNEALKQHDYGYDQSDDSRVYDKGKLEESILLEHTARHPKLKLLWTIYVKEKAGK